LGTAWALYVAAGALEPLVLEGCALAVYLLLKVVERLRRLRDGMYGKASLIEESLVWGLLPAAMAASLWAAIHERVYGVQPSWSEVVVFVMAVGAATLSPIVKAILRHSAEANDPNAATGRAA